MIPHMHLMKRMVTLVTELVFVGIFLSPPCHQSPSTQMQSPHEWLQYGLRAVTFQELESIMIPFGP